MSHEDDSHQPARNGYSQHRDNNDGRSSAGLVLDIYPLTNYYFDYKDAVPFKEETVADRLDRMKSNFRAHGLRTCVQAVLLVEIFKHPHVLLLQTRNSIFSLPGGRSRPGESDAECLRRKLSSKLSVIRDGGRPDWDVAECLGMWWKHGFETLLCPYLPLNIKFPKECTKIFLVKLPETQRFTVAKNHKVLAVPFHEIHGNLKSYGPIISAVPQLLSKYSFNVVHDDL